MDHTAVRRAIMEYDTPLFFHVMQYAAEADRDVIDLVSGGPDWEPPAALREGLRVYADADPTAFQYPPSDGLSELREEIATRRGVDADRVLVTNGAGEANYLAMAEALERDAGSEVLLTDPVYPYYPGKAQMLGADVRFVPVAADGGLDVAAMQAAAGSETAAIVLNSPNNPTGAVYDEPTMSAMADLAADSDAVLISDEVYDHYDYSGRFTSALAVTDDAVVTNSFSKSMAATGLRVGYGIFPPGLVDAARTRHMLVNVAGARPSQAAVLRALRETGPDYYEASRDLLRDRIDAFTAALDDAGAAYVAPEGAFYVFARFDGFPGTLDNVERLVDEAGVAGMPGETFGTRDGWLRFALVTPRIEAAAERLADYF
jgi:aspartate/methionine/tyrosine aminotransferase